MFTEKWLQKEIQSLKKWEAEIDKKLEKLEAIAGMKKSKNKVAKNKV